MLIIYSTDLKKKTVSIQVPVVTSTKKMYVVACFLLYITTLLFSLCLWGQIIFSYFNGKNNKAICENLKRDFSFSLM